MTIPQEKIEELASRLREVVPNDISTLNFSAYDAFFNDFEAFKVPLIVYLSDKVEVAIRTIPDGISEEFAEGYLDGTLALIRLIADLQLVKNT